MGNRIVAHLDVVGAPPVGAFPDLTPGVNGLGNDNCKTRRETFKFWNLMRLYIRDLTVYYELTSPYRKYICRNHSMQCIRVFWYGAMQDKQSRLFLVIQKTCSCNKTTSKMCYRIEVSNSKTLICPFPLVSSKPRICNGQCTDSTNHELAWARATRLLVYKFNS